MTLQIKQWRQLKIETYIVTSIVSHTIGLAGMLIMINVSTFKTPIVLCLYTYKTMTLNHIDNICLVLRIRTLKYLEGSMS